MDYYYDTEFIEGTQRKSFLRKTKPTIDLISIGIVSEDGREYYAISKDFNLKEAWNRYDEKVNMNYKPTFGGGSDGHYNPKFIKEYWIRENVLKPIFMDLLHKFNPAKHDIFDIKLKDFTYRNLSKLIKKYGKTNKQIAEEIIDFCAAKKNIFETDGLGQAAEARLEDNPIKLYGYYSAYDHVALCWLFGNMIDLPKGFPMYTRDLKQELDMKLNRANLPLRGLSTNPNKNLESKLKEVKSYKNYPKQDNEHNALDDAKWNKKLHEFIKHGLR